MLKSITTLFRKKYRKNTFRKSGSAEVLTLLTLLSQKYNADLEKSGSAVGADNASVAKRYRKSCII